MIWEQDAKYACNCASGLGKAVGITNASKELPPGHTPSGAIGDVGIAKPS